MISPVPPPETGNRLIINFRYEYLEILVESRQCDVVPAEIESHGGVDVVGVQLHVDLFVDAGLTFGGVMLTTTRSRHFSFSG